MSRGVVGILLAAGFARRFGSDKRLQRLADGRAMAVVAAGQLLQAGVPVIAVLRPEDAELAELLAAAGCEVVNAAAAQFGMGHSLAAGVAASPDAAGWLVALADMPRLQVASHRAVLAALHAGASLARSEHAGQAGHPVGFAARWREQLLALSGDAGARQLVQAGAAELVRCPVDDPGVLFDVDLPGDLA